MKQKWIDISVPLRTGMVHWPGDADVSIERFKDLAHGDSSTVSAVNMTAHTGTHMDSPMHFFVDGKGIETMPFEATIGPARVIEIRDRDTIKAAELRGHRIRRGERVLFKTYGSAARWRNPEFDKKYVYISPEAAEYLAERGVRTVGIDYLSVGGYKKESAETHRALLGAGIWVIEGLNLDGVKPGRYDLICLPLRMADGEGAPARAVLRRRG